MSVINTANTALTSRATGAAGRLATTASKPGILGKLAGFLGKGLKLFAGLGPWGKAATLALGVVGVSKAVSSHPASRRVG